jgi:hypothetical protein
MLILFTTGTLAIETPLSLLSSAIIYYALVRVF